jgi:hypothetical protein
VEVDEELICYTVAALMPTVRWTRDGDPTPLTRKFLTVSRRVKLFNEVDTKEKPACFQAEWATQEEQKTNLPYKSTVEIRWIIYQSLGMDPKALPTIENNLILRGVRAALAPKPDDPGFLDRRNTLGGLVHHCFVGGTIFKDPGDIDNEGMLVVPIKVLVP